MKKTVIISACASLAFLYCGWWEDMPVEEEGDVVPRQYSGGMVLVRARDSTFQMGSENNPQGAITQPVHAVRFTYDFWMDTTEVTQATFDLVIKAVYADCDTGMWDERYGKGERHPVHERNWFDAVLYCNAQSKRESFDTVYRYDSIVGTVGNGCGLAGMSIDTQVIGYRLPTEAEWEYACRAGSTGEFYWGNDAPETYAWCAGNAAGTSRSVAQKKPNDFGLYDMSGNIREWCNDWYVPAYPDSAVINPVAIAGLYNRRVKRGGSWLETTEGISSSTRFYEYPSVKDRYTGFRTVLRKR
ncbi:MAG: SUMF1/EgtB/PvdO family nonheme iron enzyme [Chitinispirillaceae bacterium]|nr:SUMF1/EgtB/PvdO family nonheme iron enzyme [Chitinispirillaceae bacterium]